MSRNCKENKFMAFYNTTTLCEISPLKETNSITCFLQMPQNDIYSNDKSLSQPMELYILPSS